MDLKLWYAFLLMVLAGLLACEKEETPEWEPRQAPEGISVQVILDTIPGTDDEFCYYIVCNSQRNDIQSFGAGIYVWQKGIDEKWTIGECPVFSEGMKIPLAQVFRGYPQQYPNSINLDDLDPRFDSIAYYYGGFCWENNERNWHPEIVLTDGTTISWDYYWTFPAMPAVASMDVVDKTITYSLADNNNRPYRIWDWELLVINGSDTTTVEMEGGVHPQQEVNYQIPASISTPVGANIVFTATYERNTVFAQVTTTYTVGGVGGKVNNKF